MYYWLTLLRNSESLFWIFPYTGPNDIDNKSHFVLTNLVIGVVEALLLGILAYSGASKLLLMLNTLVVIDAVTALINSYQRKMMSTRGQIKIPALEWVGCLPQLLVPSIYFICVAVFA